MEIPVYLNLSSTVTDIEELLKKVCIATLSKLVIVDNKDYGLCLLLISTVCWCCPCQSNTLAPEIAPGACGCFRGRMSPKL